MQQQHRPFMFSLLGVCLLQSLDVEVVFDFVLSWAFVGRSTWRISPPPVKLSV
ncbi:hypothetical protein BKA81DRAFT_365702 [Phyllosticta paracitricarpa]